MKQGTREKECEKYQGWFEQRNPQTPIQSHGSGSSEKEDVSVRILYWRKLERVAQDELY